LLTYSCCDS
jgi:hypothetical protein